jgi:hypothetical protein
MSASAASPPTHTAFSWVPLLLYRRPPHNNTTDAPGVCTIYDVQKCIKQPQHRPFIIPRLFEIHK